MSNIDFLSIGSVVSLTGGTKKIMVVGFLGINEEDNVTYDYIGCLYPEGYLDDSSVLLFNHNQIEHIYFNGYSDEDDKQFKFKLTDLKNDSTDLEDIEIIENDYNDIDIVEKEEETNRDSFSIEF